MLALRDLLETGLKAISPRAVIFGAGAERLPNTTLFAVEGMKAETAVIAFDLEGIGGVVGRRLLLRQGAALPCPCGHGGFAVAHARRRACQPGLDDDEIRR